jgi:sarcosine oxidase, subunit beta
MTGYDVAIVGAGSIGLPAAHFLAEAGVRVGVFDPLPSAGRGENRAAIGGVRATHSEPAKAVLGQESIEVFATWRDRLGDDLEWRRGGYLFVAYRDEDEEALRSVIAVQQAMGLGISWVGPGEVSDLVPGIAAAGLRGGSHSPGDGSASPLVAAHAFRTHAERSGAVFHFGEPVVAVDARGDRVRAVTTPRGVYPVRFLVNAAGAAAGAVGRMVGLDLPVAPDAHEAAITAPVARLFEPMVVDLRPGPGSKSCYFYQSASGQILFCLTPNPPIAGTDRRSTSAFLPMVARRLVAVLPRLRHLQVRRTWRGLYPATPDGSPLLGWAGPEGSLVAAGMCGQGFMLGPGVGRLIARAVTDSATASDDAILEELAPDRDFVSMEVLT